MYTVFSRLLSSKSFETFGNPLALLRRTSRVDVHRFLFLPFYVSNAGYFLLILRCRSMLASLATHTRLLQCQRIVVKKTNGLRKRVLSAYVLLTHGTVWQLVVNVEALSFSGRITAICLGLLALVIGIVLSSIPWVDYIILKVSMDQRIVNSRIRMRTYTHECARESSMECTLYERDDCAAIWQRLHAVNTTEDIHCTLCACVITLLTLLIKERRCMLAGRWWWCKNKLHL